MKKSLILLALLLGLSFGATKVSALTITSLSPNQVVKSVGSTFDVTIVITPDSKVPIYSAKIGLNYNPDMLEVTHFKYGDNLMQLSQPGYDVMDNANGILVKTAGFPGGLASQIIFGTVTFRVKAAGTGVVVLSANGVALDANNANTFTRTTVAGSTSVTTPGATASPNPQVLGASTATPKKTVTTTKTKSKTTVRSTSTSSNPVISPEASSSDTGLTDSSGSTTADESSTTGSVLGAAVSNTGSGSWWAIGIGLVVLLIVIGVVYSIAREV